MSTTQARSKAVHPNRLVTKHEEYLINKSLANKVRHAKSTINAGNVNYERIIITRQKKDLPRSSHSKIKPIEELRELEEDQKNAKDQLNDKPTEFIIKTTEPRARRLPGSFFLSPSSRDNTNTLPTSGRYGYNSHLGTPKDHIDKSQYSKTIEDIVIKNDMRNIEGVVPIGNKGVRARKDVVSLTNQLIEKNLEIEQLKHELKEWWHDDFKNIVKSELKENRVANRGYTAHLFGENETKNAHVVKTTKPSTQDLFKRQKSDITIKKDGSSNRMGQRKSNEASVRPGSYDCNQKILEKLEIFDKNPPKKRLEPLQKYNEVGLGKKGPNERPSSVKNKAAANNDKFKLRFSNNNMEGLLKLNARYKSEGVDTIDEAIEQENFAVDTPLNEPEIEEEIKPIVKENHVNNRYQTHEDEVEEELTEAESPEIVTTSKTLMLQSRVINSRINNNNDFRMTNNLRDSEVIIE